MAQVPSPSSSPNLETVEQKKVSSSKVLLPSTPSPSVLDIDDDSCHDSDSSPPQHPACSPYSSFEQDQAPKGEEKSTQRGKTSVRRRPQDTAGGRSAANVRPSPIVLRAVDLIRLHSLGQIEDTESEAYELRVSPLEYGQLWDLLERPANQELLYHFKYKLRHDYIAGRHCLILHLMADALHEVLLHDVKDELEQGLKSVKERAEVEVARLAQEAAQQVEDGKKGLRLISDTVDQILRNWGHAWVYFDEDMKKGSKRSPDIQFRHKSTHPYFVGEIGWSQKPTSLRKAVEDYYELSDTIKTILAIDVTHLTANQLQQSEATSDRSAAVWLYRDAEQTLHAVFRDSNGSLQDGTAVTLYLSDFISDETIADLASQLLPDQREKWHPSTLAMDIPLSRLYDLLNIAEEAHTLPPKPTPAVLKRKVRHLDSNSAGSRSAPKRQRLAVPRRQSARHRQQELAPEPGE